jgi:LuxR family maltose regulon positive regulatory protein
VGRDYSLTGRLAFIGTSRQWSAAPQDYIRLFADEGQPIARLLSRVSPYTIASPTYIRTLLAATTPDQPIESNLTPPDQHSLLDPLSNREREVLSLLASGASNQPIAAQLVIILNTTKRHVKHILAKLSVTNRTQAVARARELNLL